MKSFSRTLSFLMTMFRVRSTAPGSKQRVGLVDERSGPERFLETFDVLLELIRAVGPEPDVRGADGPAH